MIKAITQCRICGNAKLDPVIDLGSQALTGIFPRYSHQPLTTGPLAIVQCRNEDPNCCGLVQLGHTYAIKELYGDHYGYRSSLNQSMVHHLRDIVGTIIDRVQLSPDDIALDIGSNDGTLLKSYPKGSGRLAGMDPGGKAFQKYYSAHIELITDFFSSAAFRKVFGQKKAKVVTAIAMFYDLEDPLAFMKDVYDILTDDGIWVFEQSYMPAMLKKVAYDTICHEHFEYYGLKQIKWMTDRVGFKIIDVEFNSVNGGSFLVTVAKSANQRYLEHTKLINQILEDEAGLDKESFKTFQQDIEQCRDRLVRFVRQVKQDNKTIFGYGASTKGNVILQYCGFTSDDITCIAEVNEDKFGCITPGTNIPIISELEAKQLAPDYFLVLPWHFKDNIIVREKDYLKSGGTLVFPLPFIEECTA